MKRLFVAIDLASAVLQRVEQLREALSETLDDDVRIKWTGSPQLHVTLKFLGDTAEQDIPPLANVLDEIAGRTAPFSVQTRGIGCFPRPDDPRVIWVGFDDDSVTHLTRLHDEIDDGLEAHGVPPENRSFVPHLTIGRVKSTPRPHLSDILEEAERGSFGASRVDDILLYESTLAPDGATHAIIRRFRLQT